MSSYYKFDEDAFEKEKKMAVEEVLDEYRSNPQPSLSISAWRDWFIGDPQYREWADAVFEDSFDLPAGDFTQQFKAGYPHWQDNPKLKKVR